MKKVISSIIAVIAMVVLTAYPAIATATFTGSITVTTASALTSPMVRVAMPNSDLVTNGFISASGLDVKVDNGGSALPMMLTSAYTYFVPSTLVAGSSTFTWSAGNTPVSAHYIILGQNGSLVGTNGLTGNTWAYEIKGYFDLSQAGSFSTTDWVGGANPYIHIERVSSTSVRAVLFDSATNTATATGLTSGAHTLKVVSSTNLEIYWDGVLKDSVAHTTSMPGGTPTISYLTDGDLMPYIEYQKIGDVTLSTLTSWYQPVSIISGTTLPDRSAGGDTGTVTLGIGLATAALTSFTPSSQAQLTGYSSTVLNALNLTTPDTPTNMYTEGNNSIFEAFGGLVLEEVITGTQSDAATSTAWKTLIFVPIAFIVSLIAGFAAFHFTKQLLIQSFVSTIVMAMFALGTGGGVIPTWTLFVFPIECLGIMVMANPFVG